MMWTLGCSLFGWRRSGETKGMVLRKTAAGVRSSIDTNPALGALAGCKSPEQMGAQSQKDQGWEPN